MTYSPIPSNHLMADVLPSSSRSLAAVTLAAARASRPSNHRLYGFDPSSRRYSLTTMVESNGNVLVTTVPGTTGMDDYVTKPIRVDALVQALTNTTGRGNG